MKRAVAFGLFVIGALVVAAFGKFFVRTSVDEILPQATTETIEQQLIKAVEMVNSQLSQTRMGNEQIAMDSVALAPNKTVVWRFRVLGLNELPPEKLDQLFAMNRDRACAGNLRRFLDAGYLFSYEYWGDKPYSGYAINVRGPDCYK